jgi:protein-tyrosine phosphatase
LEKQRLLNIKNGYNFRDLGGYPTTDGHHIQWHRILRSGELAELSTDDLACLNQYHINYDIDLRSDNERNQAADLLPQGAKLVANPIFNSGHDKTNQQYAQQYLNDATLGKKTMIQSYQMMVTSSEAQKAFHNFFQILLQNQTGAILFHCAQGKDRTGLAAAFLLFALGVDEQTIKQDYLLSKPAMEPFVARKTEQYRPYGMTPALKQNLYNLYTVDAEYLDAALVTIHEQYVSMDHFLHEFIGLTDADIDQLKALYLTK